MLSTGRSRLTWLGVCVEQHIEWHRALEGHGRVGPELARHQNESTADYAQHPPPGATATMLVVDRRKRAAWSTSASVRGRAGAAPVRSQQQQFDQRLPRDSTRAAGLLEEAGARHAELHRPPLVTAPGAGPGAPGTRRTAGEWVTSRRRRLEDAWWSPSIARRATAAPCRAGHGGQLPLQSWWSAMRGSMSGLDFAEISTPSAACSSRRGRRR